MQAKLALSLALTAVILAAGALLLVRDRLAGPEPDRSSGTEAGAGRPAGEAPDPLRSTDPRVKLDHLIEKLEETSSDGYDYYTDLSKDLFDLKTEVRQLKSTLKQVVQGLGRGPGSPIAIGWGLAGKGEALSAEARTAYLEATAAHGIRVEEGRVTVRGFLNMSPDTRMPIEYYITRFPESSHETLVHLVGDKDVAELQENPYGALKGLPTALYKGLVAAGFREGEPMHPDLNSDPRSPTWVLATGDVVYVGVRYAHGGETHTARATDWVLDPAAGTVLPPDCFRFTGGTRGEDPDTGETVLAAEAMGLLVSVWPTYSALVEVSLRSSLRNDFAYNFARIPKPQGTDPLYVDVVFSRTPIEPEGEGARPLEKAPAGDTGDGAPEGSPGDPPRDEGR